MPFSNDLSVRKHAQNFLRQLDVKNLEDYKVGSQKFSTLCAVRKDARLAATSILDKVKDGMPEDRASELEAAHDGVSQFLAAIEAELDFRNENGGDRDQGSNSIDYSKRPQFEDRVSPAVDGGVIDVPEPEAFALRNDQSVRTWAQPKCDRAYDQLGLGRYLRSMIVGPKTEIEGRALAEGTDSAGGFTVPTALSTELIDRLRAASVINRAGARTIPLTSDVNVIAKLASDPQPAFRVENAAVSESDPTFSSITLTPRSIAMKTLISRELFEDSLNLESELPRILSEALAKEIDRVCLLGSGTSPEPRGVANVSGIGTTALGGALTSYSPLIAAETAILTSNAGPVSAIIAHPREMCDLASLVDTTGQSLRRPEALAGIPLLSTTAIPIDGGAGSNESTIFVGNFNHLLIGVRSGIRVEILRELYAGTHQYGLIAHARFDVAVEHAAAFHTITGVQS
jgi:HK97 family phage major capsid protein